MKSMILAFCVAGVAYVAMLVALAVAPPPPEEPELTLEDLGL